MRVRERESAEIDRYNLFRCSGRDGTIKALELLHGGASLSV